MHEAFTDHFASRAADYARYRPAYPPALIRFLAGSAPGRGLAWDCGTGSGQAAVMLAAEFGAVLATDPSPEQLSHARAHPRVRYRQAREADAGLDAGSADLVTAAQAAHWFDLPAFYRESQRVLRPGGILAVWCYGLMRVDAAVDPVLAAFYHDRLGPCWPPGRRHVDAGYATIGFPLPLLAAPPFAIEMAMTRPALLGYIGTWSAVARARARDGADPLEALGRDLEPLWPDAEAPRTVRWPLSLLAGRAPPAG